MSTLRNKVQLIGNVGEVPEIKILDNGKKVVKFSLATNESYKNDKGEKVTSTEWHKIVAWNKMAEIVQQIVKKGDEIAVSGKLTYSTWDDDKGVKRNNCDILCNEIVQLSKNSK